MAPGLRRDWCLGLALMALAGGSGGGAQAAPPAESAGGPPEHSVPLELPPDVDDLAELMKRPVVITPSKVEQSPAEAPSAITVVTAEEIKLYGHRTLADVLRTVPGMHTTYDRNYTFLGVRGFSRGDINSLNSRMLLLVDGHRVNNNLTDGAFIGTEFLLDVDLIDRVEVIRGPGSVLYGNHALFGIINVVTKNGRQFRHGEVSGEAASYDTYKGRVTLGHDWQNGWELLLSGTLYDRAGPSGAVPRLDEDGYGSFFGKVRFRDVTLQGAFTSREKSNPTGQFLAPPNDPRLRTVDDRSYANLKYHHDFEDVVAVTAQVYYDRNDFYLGLPQQPGYGPPDLFMDLGVGEWWGAELQLTRRWRDRHTLTLGAEYRDDFRQSYIQTSDLALPPAFERSDTTRNHGVYLHGDFALLTNLHFNAGFRYDQYGDLDPTFNPRLALIWNPIRQATVKAIYGTAFRAPNFVETILARQDAELEPETIRTYELIYEQGLGRHLRASVAGFYNQIDGLISFQSGNFANQDAEAWGVETGLEGFWGGGLRGRLSYTFQETRDRATRLLLTDSPQHLAKANLTVPLYRDKLFGGLEFQYTGRRTTLRLAGSGPATVPGRDAEGYGVVNFTLFSQNVLKGLEWSAGVYNLLDERYADPATSHHRDELIYQDGRTFRVKLLYRF